MHPPTCGHNRASMCDRGAVLPPGLQDKVEAGMTQILDLDTLAGVARWIETWLAHVEWAPSLVQCRWGYHRILLIGRRWSIQDRNR